MMKHMKDFENCSDMKNKNIKTEVINIEVENTSSTSGIENKKTEDVIDHKSFKLPKQAEDTLDSYINKLEDYYSKIGEEKIDIIAQKAKVLQAVLEADMLHTK